MRTTGASTSSKPADSESPRAAPGSRICNSAAQPIAYCCVQPPRRATMSFTSEFKEFAVKGNVIDLAVGVIIGAAFGKIVDSAVNDLIMPVVGRFVGGLDF